MSLRRAPQMRGSQFLTLQVRDADEWRQDGRRTSGLPEASVIQSAWDTAGVLGTEDRGNPVGAENPIHAC